MFLTQTTIRSTLSVCVVLVFAFLSTGFISAAYHRERARLGDEHFEEGQQLAAKGDFVAATEEYRKALLFTPDSKEFRLSLATALVRAGKLDEAESHVEQLLQEDPTNGRINLLLARIAEQQHHTNLAIDSYQRAVYEYWPPDELSKRREARWELIHLLETENGKRHNDLIGELLQLYGNLPPASDQRLKVGQELLRNGADADAAGVFHDVLKGAPQDPTAHRGLAVIAFRAGDYIQARHEYQRALRTAPNDQDSEKGLQLSNEIIDIAPELPNISAAERLRRSTNLLNRVKSDLEHCAGTVAAGSPLQQRLDEIDQALKTKPTGADDQAAKVQTLAENLWHDRASLCGSGPVIDPALEAVLPRLNHE